MKLLFAVLPTISLAVFSQLMMKWRVSQIYQTQALQNDEQLSRVVTYFSDPWLVSAYASTFLGSIAWMFVVEKYDISVSFPVYIGSTFMLVMLGGCLILKEPLSLIRVVAVFLIFLGIVIGSYGQ